MISLKICCIVVHHKKPKVLERCLDAIVRTKYPGLKIVVLDNASVKKTFKELQEKFPQIDFIKSKKNLGFAGGNNRAIAYALKNYQPDYFLLINDDVFVFKSIFEITYSYLEKGFALISPIVLLDKNRGIDSAGIDYFRSGYAYNRKKYPQKKYLLNAACLFINASFVKELLALFGWIFNPLFFAYLEDVELSLQAILMGKSIKLVKKPAALHQKSQTLSSHPKKIFYLAKRNELWTIITVWPMSIILKNLPFILVGQVAVWLNFIKKGNLHFLIYLYIKTVRFLPQLIKIRRIVQGVRVVGIRKFENIFTGYFTIKADRALCLKQ